MLSNKMVDMKIHNRRLFLHSLAIGSIGIPFGFDLPHPEQKHSKYIIQIKRQIRLAIRVSQHSFELNHKSYLTSDSIQTHYKFDISFLQTLLPPFRYIFLQKYLLLFQVRENRGLPSS